MPVFLVQQRFSFPRPAVFAFFRRPANVVAVAPPGLRLRLVSAPELVTAGARVTVQSRRFGLATEVITEVVEVIEPEQIVEEQRHGPFRRWRHERHFAALDEGNTEVSERIDYEPPGGLLGLTLSPERIVAELEEAYRWRQARVEEMLTSGGFSLDRPGEANAE